MPSLRSLGTAAAALFAVAAYAQDNDDDYEVRGNLTSISTFNASSIRPNATLAAEFPAWDLGEDWFWRVNVTSISRPNARAPTGREDVEPEELVDAHIVRTTYDMSWPAGGSLAGNTGNASKICLSLIERQDWPANISTLYQARDDGRYNTSCAPILGDDCVAAIIRDQIYDNTTDSCGLARSISSIDECRDSVAWGRDLSISTTGIDLAAMETLESGQGFYARFLEAHNGTDADRYLRYAKEQVHMAISEIVYHEDNGMVRTGRQLHCLRAEPATEVVKSPEEENKDEEDEDNEGANNDDDDDDDSGVASVRSEGVAWVMAFAGAAALSVVLA